MVEFLKLPIDPMDPTDTVQQTAFLAKWFPHLFAKALVPPLIVPINPDKWPAFVAGSAMASNMPELGDKIKTPLNNLVVAKEFLETSKSDIQWRDRLWKLIEDTTTINFSAEIGRDLGAFGAGGASEKIADGYMDEMINTTLTMTKTEKLNDRIFKQFAEEQGYNSSLVRGTGVFRQFVPKSSRGNILDRPPRGSRPL